MIDRNARKRLWPVMVNTDNCTWIFIWKHMIPIFGYGVRPKMVNAKWRIETQAGAKEQVPRHTALE